MAFELDCVFFTASARYGLRALGGGARVAALASVAGWLRDTATIAAFSGGQAGPAMRFDRARRALAQRMPHAGLAWGEAPRTDFYDQPGQVAFAVSAAARHFRACLTPVRDRESARG